MPSFISDRQCMLLRSPLRNEGESARYRHLQIRCSQVGGKEGMSVRKHNVVYCSPSASRGDIDRVCASPANGKEICAGYKAEKRTAERHSYRSGVVLSTIVEQVCEEMPVAVELFLLAWARDVSRTGVSIVTSQTVVLSDGLADHTPIIDIDAVFQNGVRGCCALLKSSASLIWMEVEVVRVQSIHDNVRELGLRFVGRNAFTKMADSDFIERLRQLWQRPRLPDVSAPPELGV
jgi:hypothetical protein